MSARLVSARRIITLLVAASPSLSFAQVDTMRVELEPIVVSAERYRNQLIESTVAISTLESADIERLPGKTLTDVIALMPGIGFINRDGDGQDGLVTIRGFYGGGDVEYLVVLVDGLPMNDMETGLVSWESIPTANIERIELLRGGSSSLYGDAAIGGVLNIITKRSAERGGLITLSVGSFNSSSVSGYVSEAVGPVPIEISGGYSTTDGFREGKERQSGSLNLNAALLSGETWSLRILSNNSWRSIDVPGPLLSGPEESSDGINRAFAGDNTDERRNGVTLEAAGSAASLSWRTAITAFSRHADSRNTLALAPFFFDTRDRVLDGKRLSLSSGGNYSATEWLSVVAGFDLGLQEYESTYFNVGSVIPTGPPVRGNANNGGTASRNFLGAYAQTELRPITKLSITAGVRVDGLWNSYSPDPPTDIIFNKSAAESEEHSETHSAISPKLGFNLSLVSADDVRLNFYTSAGTSFKSPAIDQLYGQRPITIFTEFGPLDISTSSVDLKPQRGKHLEGGIYGSLAGSFGRAELSASVYRIDMRDELDIDLSTFKLINIGESRHDGVELGANVYSPTGLTFFGSYTLQSTTFRSGDNEGKFVKAIPRDLYAFGATYSSFTGLGIGATAHGRSRTFIDDPNTTPLDNYVAVDAQAFIESDRFRFEVSLLNILDASFNSTGYPDPAGSDVQFLYPAAGRSAKVAMTLDW